MGQAHSRALAHGDGADHRRQGHRREVAVEVATLSSAHNFVPGLAVVIVGSRKDSQTYVLKACAEVGIRSVDFDMRILMQLPLPKHINEEKILSEISIEKDVDGFHHLNIGKLAMKGREPLFVPCTPKFFFAGDAWSSCQSSRSGVTVKGKRVVVVGRSNIVGLPVSLLLLKADATVSIVHSWTSNPESIVCEGYVDQRGLDQARCCGDVDQLSRRPYPEVGLPAHQ